jgi:hypothetical protein
MGANMAIAGAKGRAVCVAAADDFAQRLVPILVSVRAEGATTLRAIAAALKTKHQIASRWRLAPVLNCEPIIQAAGLAFYRSKQADRDVREVFERDG